MPGISASRLLKRVAIAGWLVLTVMGALNHTLLPGILPRPLTTALPNLRYGYVMFNRNMPEVGVLSYRDGGEYRHISDWIRTPAPGYKDARATINLLLIPDYLNYLCAQQPGEHEIRYQTYRVLASRDPFTEQRLLCRHGELRGE